MPLLAVEHEVAAIFLVHFLNVVAQLLLQPLDLRVRLAQLVLEPQHELDAGEVEADLGRQALDDAQPLDVGLAVEARAARRALRAHETLVLVDAQRLRMHADELGGDADHVDRAVGHHACRPPRADDEDTRATAAATTRDRDPAAEPPERRGRRSTRRAR